MFEWRNDIRNYFNTAPEFEVYRKSNRGEYRVLRCEFPHLMGWSKLQRPSILPRSLKTPYFSGTGALQSVNKDRILRPHDNRLKQYKDTDNNHMTLKKENIILEDGPPIHKNKTGELRVGHWKMRNRPILVRMFDKHAVNWKQAEKKTLKEICNGEEIGHPNFLQYYGSLESKFWKYHLFEHMPKGDLLRVLRSAGSMLTEEITRKIFVQIVYAVSHLHDKDLVHRNLKLETILVGDNWDIRIIDIAHAEKTMAQNHGDRNTICKTSFKTEYGPQMYKSPERLLGWGFNPLQDQVWALGVILYALIFKRFPYKFDQDEPSSIVEAVENGVKYAKGQDCPDDVRDLLSNIFQWEEHRPRSYELFDHPWLAAYPDIAELKKSNAISQYSYERAEEMRNETNRLLGVRRRMFRHFKLFREDRKRQPAKQATEIANLEGVLENAQRFIGTRPYGIHEIRENVKGQHVAERLYKEEYWPRLYKFNPLKCIYLGINRTYCKPRQYPVKTNMQRLANKNIPSYDPPPPRKGKDKNDRHDLEIADLD